AQEAPVRPAAPERPRRAPAALGHATRGPPLHGRLRMRPLVSSFQWWIDDARLQAILGGVMDDGSDVQHLWEEYKAQPSQATRDKLILHYAPLVKYVAGRVSVGLPANIEQGDLISYGIFGLIDAIDK